MEVVMNVAGVKKTNSVAPKIPVKANDAAVRENVVLRQRLAQVLALKKQLLGDKADCEEVVKSTQAELAAAQKTIADLKAKVTELTAGLAAASENVRKNKKKTEKQEKPDKPEKPEKDEKPDNDGSDSAAGAV